MKHQLPQLDFAPIFYVLDKGRARILAAKKTDKYEVKGMYLEWDAVNKKWEVYHASLNNQHFNEYPDRYDLTKEEKSAVKFAIGHAANIKLTEEQCNNRYSTGYYIS